MEKEKKKSKLKIVIPIIVVIVIFGAIVINKIDRPGATPEF